MGKFRITTTERDEDTAERATSCAIPGPDRAGSLDSRQVSCVVDSCIVDTPGYHNDAKDVSPLADGEAQE